MPTEIPVLFPDPMVRAVLKGCKTMARRPVRWPRWARRMETSATTPHVVLFTGGDERTSVGECPLGRRDDLLWVRETFARVASGGYVYRASADSRAAWRWIPSIHMPREASRILLRVTSVETQTLRKITHEEALREGFDSVEAFAEAWDAAYPRGPWWSGNPLVWAVGFEVVEVRA